MIKTYFKEHRDEIVSIMRELVAIPSIRGEREEGAPFGKECAKMLEKTEELYKENGFSTELHKDKGYLLSFLPGEKSETIGLFAHSDVVPVGNDWTYTEPFTMIEKDGFLFGRGVSDNKAGILVSLFAARAIRDLKLPLKRGLLLFTGSNEESGMEDVMAFAKEQPMPAVCLVPDVSFPGIGGEPNMLRFWADVPMPDGEIISFVGGNAFNIVMGEAKATLIYSKELYESLLSLKTDALSVGVSGDAIELIAKGAPKHVLDPEDSVNAASLIVEALLTCPYICNAQKEALQKAQKLIQSPYGEGFGIASEDPDFSKLVCANGMVSYQDNVLSFSFDTRYSPRLNAEKLEADVINCLESQGIVMRLDMHDSGYIHEKDSPLIATICEVYERVTGITGTSVSVTRGGTYSRHLKNSVSVGMENFRERPFAFPAGHGGPHQADECISIEGLLEAMEIVTEMILAVDRRVERAK